MCNLGRVQPLHARAPALEVGARHPESFWSGEGAVPSLGLFVIRSRSHSHHVGDLSAQVNKIDSRAYTNSG